MAFSIDMVASSCYRFTFFTFSQRPSFTIKSATDIPCMFQPQAASTCSNHTPLDWPRDAPPSEDNATSTQAKCSRQNGHGCCVSGGPCCRALFLDESWLSRPALPMPLHDVSKHVLHLEPSNTCSRPCFVHHFWKTTTFTESCAFFPSSSINFNRNVFADFFCLTNILQFLFPRGCCFLRHTLH